MAIEMGLTDTMTLRATIEQVVTVYHGGSAPSRGQLMHPELVFTLTERRADATAPTSVRVSAAEADVLLRLADAQRAR